MNKEQFQQKFQMLKEEMIDAKKICYSSYHPDNVQLVREANNRMRYLYDVLQPHVSTYMAPEAHGILEESRKRFDESCERFEDGIRLADKADKDI